ncbi:hypothetical protein DPEC_G00339870 [Dallia pectoralis]|uniref:Uncharacterized protein n=1 Tax=Dallia pectoralis TaxID=75939 RepID=A0ACC2F4X2_DALPE|nr:hypothetical protein DPEC_G00339870 [Dallia pectoralis]
MRSSTANVPDLKSPGRLSTSPQPRDLGQSVGVVDTLYPSLRSSTANVPDLESQGVIDFSTAQSRPTCWGIASPHTPPPANQPSVRIELG